VNLSMKNSICQKKMSKEIILKFAVWQNVSDNLVAEIAVSLFL